VGQRGLKLGCFIVFSKRFPRIHSRLAKTEACSSKWGSGTGSHLLPLREETPPIRWGSCLRPPFFHMKGFRRVRGRHQSAAKLGARRKWGDPSLRASLHRRVSSGAKPREEKSHTLVRSRPPPPPPPPPPPLKRTPLFARWRGLLLKSFSRTPQFRARQRRFHPAVADDREWWTRPLRRGQPVKRSIAGFDAPDRRSHLSVPATPACISIHRQTAGIPARTRRASTRRIRARSIVSWDDSACNPVGRSPPYEFRSPRAAVSMWKAFRHGLRHMILSQEIIVDTPATRPKDSPRIRTFRGPLGLGLRQLGALLMSSAFLTTATMAADYAGAITAVHVRPGVPYDARLSNASVRSPVTPITNSRSST